MHRVGAVASGKAPWSASADFLPSDFLQRLEILERVDGSQVGSAGIVPPPNKCSKKPLADMNDDSVLEALRDLQQVRLPAYALASPQIFSEAFARHPNSLVPA